MPVTKTIWTEDQFVNNPDPNWSQTFVDKANEMAAQGKGGTATYLRAPGEVIVERIWVSTEAAQEWQDFIAPYAPVWSATFDEIPPTP